MASRVNFRYSLLALLLITTLVCVIVSHWQARQEVTQLHSLIERQRPVLRKLHDQLGVLTVEDPSAVHAIAHSRMHYYQVGLRQDWDLRWRLYLPEATRWRLCWAFEGLPQSGLPPRRAGSFPLSTGTDSRCEVFLAVTGKSPAGWSASIRHRNIRGTWRIPKNQAQWLTEGQPLTWECAGEELERKHAWATEVFADGEPIVLLRCLPALPGATEGVLNGRSAAFISPPGNSGGWGVGSEANSNGGLQRDVGVMVWIEPIRQERLP